MKELSKKDLLLVSLMLFSLFFGAGNLIFPPFLGETAGSATWIAMAGFFVTAVGFPVLGVIVVAKSGGLNLLANKVNSIFSNTFTILVYLSIGPCLGIPRAGSLPFEMSVAPYLPDSMPISVALFLFTLIFFTVGYWLSLNPTKLVDRMGKVLTPTLLGFILIIFISALLKPLGSYGEATGAYRNSAFVTGFLEGYLTMDTIAALNFGIVIALAIKSKGVKEEKAIVTTSVKAGIIAGGLLVAIYSILGHLGATSGGRFGATENGAQTLTNVMTYIFGKPGAVLLAIVFTLACLTTCVGLIISCSQYFASLSKKITYKKWAGILTIFSMTFANLGLTKILAISVPVLNAIYPIAIMLIVLGCIDKFIKASVIVYRLTILFTGVVSVMDVLTKSGIKIEILKSILVNLPFYEAGLSWIVPAIFGMVLGIILMAINKKYYFKDQLVIKEDIEI